MTTNSEIFDKALEYQRSGQLQQAEDLYRQILIDDPEHVDALHHLGLASHRLGRREEALEYLRRAVGLSPGFAEAHNSLGVALAKAGKLDDAAQSYRRALGLRPNLAHVHNNLGLVLTQQGNLDEAEYCYRRAIMLEPRDHRIHNRLGYVLEQQGKLAEAMSAYHEALRHQPNYAIAYCNLGMVLKKQGKLDEAIDCYRRALSLTHDYPQAHNNLGIALREQGQLEEAETCLRTAIRLLPDYPEALTQLGAVLVKRGNVQEAVACCQEALRLQPDDEAAHFNLGNALKEQRDFQGAIGCFREALRLRPAYVEAHANLSQTLLQMGHWQAGWAEYEWRWKWRELEGRPGPVFEQPRWDGSPLQGRTILLYAEQGFGDTLQFIRYAPLVAERGGRVFVACQGALVDFLTACPGIDRLLPMDGPIPAVDVQAPLMSLPHILQTTPDTVPATVPYLFADAGRVESWRQKLDEVHPRDTPGQPSFLIGINWQGNPKFRNDRDRSFALKEMAPLAGLPGVRLVSLQFGEGTEQLHPLLETWPLINLGELDFADAAAVIRNLDLVVSVDSSKAHLAGGLGAPVWVALSSAPDFRWFLDREDSPWYPTMRLFRQRQPGRWQDVFERMACEVEKIRGTDILEVASHS